jgi:transposase
MGKKRRTHSAEFKSRVALEAVRGVKTAGEIAREYEVHPGQIAQWKKELLAGLPDVFKRGPSRDDKQAEREQERLERKIGQLTMDVDWLKKKCRELHIPIDEKR